MVEDKLVGLLLVGGGLAAASATSGGGNQQQEDPGALGPPSRGIVGVPGLTGQRPGGATGNPFNITLEAPDVGGTTFTSPFPDGARVGKDTNKDKDKASTSNYEQDTGNDPESNDIENPDSPFGVYEQDPAGDSTGDGLDVDPDAPTSAFGVSEIDPSGSDGSTDGKDTAKQKDKESTDSSSQPSEPEPRAITGV